MFEFFRPDPEIQLKNELGRIMENNHLDGIPLSNYVGNDRCADVCKIVENELIDNYWYVSSRRANFGDFGAFRDISDVINGSSVAYHVFLVAMKNNRAFIIDPTFGQFGTRVNIFIHEITGKTSAGKNIDLCMKALKSLGLPDAVFSCFINQSLAFLKENELLDELLDF